MRCQKCGGRPYIVKFLNVDGREVGRVLRCSCCGKKWNEYHAKPIPIAVKQRGKCNVLGCPEERRCLDIDTPGNCALYRMRNRERGRRR